MRWIAVSLVVVALVGLVIGWRATATHKGHCNPWVVKC